MGYQNSLYGSIAACGKIIPTGVEVVTGAAIEGKPFNIHSVDRLGVGNYRVNIGTLDGSDGVDRLNRAVLLTPMQVFAAPPILVAVELIGDVETSDNKVHVLAFNLAGQPVDAAFSISVERTSMGV